MSLLTNNIQPEENVVKDYAENDVLCGRKAYGQDDSNHRGNRKYRNCVRGCQECMVDIYEQKHLVLAKTVVTSVRSKTGRFLQQDTATGVWYDMGDRKATALTMQIIKKQRNGIEDPIEEHIDWDTIIPGLVSAVKKTTTDRKRKKFGQEQNGQGQQQDGVYHGPNAAAVAAAVAASSAPPHDNEDEEEDGSKNNKKQRHNNESPPEYPPGEYLLGSETVDAAAAARYEEDEVAPQQEPPPVQQPPQPYHNNGGDGAAGDHGNNNDDQAAASQEQPPPPAYDSDDDRKPPARGRDIHQQGEQQYHRHRDDDDDEMRCADTHPADPRAFEQPAVPRSRRRRSGGGAADEEAEDLDHRPERMVRGPDHRRGGGGDGDRPDRDMMVRSPPHRDDMHGPRPGDTMDGPRGGSGRRPQQRDYDREEVAGPERYAGGDAMPAPRQASSLRTSTHRRRDSYEERGPRPRPRVDRDFDDEPYQAGRRRIAAYDDDYDDDPRYPVPRPPRRRSHDDDSDDGYDDAPGRVRGRRRRDSMQGRHHRRDYDDHDEDRWDPDDEVEDLGDPIEYFQQHPQGQRILSGMAQMLHGEEQRRRPRPTNSSGRRTGNGQIFLRRQESPEPLGRGRASDRDDRGPRYPDDEDNFEDRDQGREEEFRRPPAHPRSRRTLSPAYQNVPRPRPRSIDDLDDSPRGPRSRDYPRRERQSRQSYNPEPRAGRRRADDFPDEGYRDRVREPASPVSGGRDINYPQYEERPRGVRGSNSHQQQQSRAAASSSAMPEEARARRPAAAASTNAGRDSTGHRASAANAADVSVPPENQPNFPPGGHESESMVDIMNIDMEDCGGSTLSALPTLQLNDNSSYVADQGPSPEGAEADRGK